MNAVAPIFASTVHLAVPLAVALAVATPTLPVQGAPQNQASTSASDTGQRAADPAAHPPIVETIDAKAKAILDTAVAKARSLKSLAVDVQMKLERPDGTAAEDGLAMMPPEFGSRYRTKMEFAEKPNLEAMQLGRVRVERFASDAQANELGVAAGAIAEVLTSDGTATTFVQLGKKKYATGAASGELAQAAFVGLPQWFIEQRLAAATAGADGAPKSKLLAASILGTTTIDAAECDLVKLVREIDLGSLAELPDGVSSTLSIVETIAFAKSDGLPRKVTSVPQMPGLPDGEMLVTPTTYYTAITLNPTFPESTFMMGAPEGFTKVEAAELLEAGSESLRIGRLEGVDDAVDAADAANADGAREPDPASPDGAAAGAPSVAKVGDLAPDFALKDFDGNEVTMDSLRGQVVLLDFWATWCGPCKAAMPTMQKLADEYKDRGAVVLGVNTMENDPATAKKYMESKNFTYGCVVRGDGLAQMYDVRAIPTLVLIGKDGKIRSIEVGLADPSGESLRKAIDDALSGG
jgi:thiol-disulfide isomerase/thioredoxin